MKTDIKLLEDKLVKQQYQNRIYSTVFFDLRKDITLLKKKERKNEKQDMRVAFERLT